MVYRIVWEIDGRTMGQEYAFPEEALMHCNDIQGWIPNARIVEVNEDREPLHNSQVFEVKDPDPPKSQWDRLNDD